jgi:hypothetical protein
MEGRMKVDGAGIQKVMKVSMRYAAGGCIIIRSKLRPRCARDQETRFTFDRRPDRAARKLMCCVSRQSGDAERVRAMALQESGGDFNAVVIDASTFR